VTQCWLPIGAPREQQPEAVAGTGYVGDELVNHLRHALDERLSLQIGRRIVKDPGTGLVERRQS